ncbi:MULTISPECIES: histidine phosphatase family protein [unclassified Niallia]|uniref:histidine phosphatase family protein n=1 Tax=unclassified Niallia TaxID=2837522 RepID=UPI001EDB0680|nr:MULTISPECIES: histidine phosphatase family protein [unclassified Niallia]MDL0434347.1 histidine phosphatase family protein [Niallia sp. SS-2023]UPO89093.1 histidine phosphatase family protein [Niallia sp. Man26]
MKLGLIRHGSTAWNREGRAQGSSNIPLDKEGVDGARLLADRLCQDNWDVIYTSDLMRAKQTAEIMAERLQIKVIFDSRLRETGGGMIEGTTERERIARWGEDWRELDLGIESVESVKARTQAFRSERLDKAIHQNILIVSHGALLTMLIAELDPQVSVEHPLKNTSFTNFSFIDNSWKCSLYNCTTHLT